MFHLIPNGYDLKPGTILWENLHADLLQVNGAHFHERDTNFLHTPVPSTEPNERRIGAPTFAIRDILLEHAESWSTRHLHLE
jgi:hypothetical protein